MKNAKPKHTPGPWSVALKFDGEAPIYRLCVAVRPEEEKPNASLIAAAPDMLEALENIKKFNWTGNGPSGCDAHCINHHCGPCRFETSLHGYINKVIKKAKGE